MIKVPPIKYDSFEIKARLGRSGFTYRRMAKESGFSEPSLRAALKKPSVRVNAYIAGVLGIPVHVLWPHWFEEDGTLIPAKYRRKLSSQRQTMASHESRDLQSA